jgi:two-component system response regulator
MSIELDNGRIAQILLVEDNENDVILTQEGFEMARLSVGLHHVWNGKECMEFLRKQGRFHDVPTPDLILLDLNMPVMNGHAVIEEVVKDETLQHIPIIVMTTSMVEQDILSAYKLRVSSYIVKPVDVEQFVDVVRDLGNYWFTVVVLPHNDVG